MAQMGQQELLALAKTQLSLSPKASATSVPPAYLQELKTHINLYPYDTNFRTTAQPKKGFGVVTCLEDGCDGVSIPLIKRVKAKDGGLHEGVGSLSAYRTHIEGHATHKTKRLARVKAGVSAGGSHVASAGTSRPPIVKKESILDALEASSPFSTPKRQPFGSQRTYVPSSSSPAGPSGTTKPPIVKRSSLVRLTPRTSVKGEPVESAIPRKRVSDVAFGAHEDDKMLVKKPKPEEKVPLAQVNRNMVVAKREPLPASLPPVDVADIRFKIDLTQSQISHTQSVYDRIQRKKKKTKADITRLAHHASDLMRLRKQKEDYNALLPRVASPIKRTGSKILTKTESLPKLPAPAFYNPAMGAAKPKTEALHTVFPPINGDVKTVLPYNAVASGSEARVLPSFASDDEMDVDVDPMITINKYRDAIPYIAPVGGADHNDANGDYHGRGRDTFQGPQARQDDAFSIDKFLVQACNAESFDGEASIDKALDKLGLQSTHQLLPSLDIPLMPHQLLGVAWMYEKETKAPGSIKGGLLGDEMGLGKTVQTIALMCKNPSEDPACKTTLIVAPLALLTQWNQEISTKTNADWKVLIYHGANRPKKKSDLLKYDVVLTTYSALQTMSLEWPDFEAEQKKKEKTKKTKPADDFIVSDSDDSGTDRPTKKKGKKDRGLLFQVDFYRIVLDEAQNIRNKRTRVSRAVTELSSIYRWCLTATPIINSLADVYGYLRFLKIRPWYDWAEFNGHVAKYEKKQPNTAVTRLQAIFGLFMIRRVKTSMLGGKRLIELPEKVVELVSLSFSDEERDIYTRVETMQQAKFNRYLKAGTVLKNYASVLVMLLRLRQLCSHPALIQENGSYFLAPEESDDTEEFREELSRARVVMSPQFVTEMKKKFKEAALLRIQAEKESPDAVADQDDCPICFDALTSAVVTPCGHQFCKDCLDNVLEMPLPDQANNGDIRYTADERPCPACRSAISSEKLFASAAFEPTDKDLKGDADDDGSDVEMLDAELLDAEPTKSKAKGKAKAKGKRPARKSAARKFVVLDSSDAEVDQEETASEDDEGDSDLSDFIVGSDEDEEEKDARRNLKKRIGKRRAIIVESDSEEEAGNDDTPEEKEVLFGARPKLSKKAVKLMPRFLPSAKMKHMMENLKQLVEDHPDEKTLIISQWTGCLTIVSDYLTECGIVHVKYQGDMSAKQREQAVQVFMSKDKARVMLMSLKCGGVGLNLTRANNVIALDLGWSPAIDQQAQDRVHRLGQTRKVLVKRLVIENTVEDRILALQERKQGLADGSLGEGTAKKIGRLSVRELASLFGLNARGQVLAKD
ncbi:SNF2 family N-terminal domain-containing protein [Mycena rosella]|uniref:SNF2 family N-terminal domain-containing protein n=1 Tax=Mycena rosella TaxID=1033263 RepID=A0AAD7CRV0_MYCRO|nr:SNF2 family N-terminal domain-containing protein [Mycena rosella]